MPDEHKEDPGEISRYEFSGIDERHGTIPKWLGFVYVALADLDGLLPGSLLDRQGVKP